MKKVGWIGCGNMGEAMLAGALNAGWCTAEEMVVHTARSARSESLAATYGVTALPDNRAVAQAARIVVLAVKPNIYETVLTEIADVLQADQIVLAIAPAYSISAVYRVLNRNDVPVARAMPNTPSMIGQGVAGVCFSEQMCAEDRALVLSFFDAFGQGIEVREELMHAVGSVSGSAPAFVYMMIEGMAEGAIALGIPAADAYRFAAHTVAGAAGMVVETGTHPAVLRDAVCSAGGTTIAGVAALESSGFKGKVIEAMRASSTRFLDMEQAANRPS